MSMMVGYARTSTVEQEAGLDAQQRDLKAAGCGKVFAEWVSSIAPRAKLEGALEYVREGDTLVVCKPDRLARSTADLLAIVARLEAKGVALRVLSMGGNEVDTRTATGKLMLTMLGAIAAFERDLMLERQREGIAKAKAEGKYKGRVPTAQRQASDVLKLRAEGVRPVDIAERLGIGRASVYWVLKDAEAA
jgi:DNA invertase Pin-like site-specific DNA recombinase